MCFSGAVAWLRLICPFQGALLGVGMARFTSSCMVRTPLFLTRGAWSCKAMSGFTVAIRGKADIPSCTAMSAFDPKRTWAVHCGNGFDAGFSPVKVLLSQYNGAS